MNLLKKFFSYSLREIFFKHSLWIHRSIKYMMFERINLEDKDGIA